MIKGSHVSDYEKTYEAGVKAGNGTLEQRETLKKFTKGIDEIWGRNQRRQLDLSRKSRMVYAEKSGHSVNRSSRIWWQRRLSGFWLHYDQFPFKF
jgi:hypothetical protein